MSAYTLIETQLVSEEHLVRALEDVGFEQVERHAAAQPLVGFEGLRREQRAEIIIRKRYLDAASNDLGFAQAPLLDVEPASVIDQGGGDGDPRRHTDPSAIHPRGVRAARRFRAERIAFGISLQPHLRRTCLHRKGHRPAPRSRC